MCNIIEYSIEDTLQLNLQIVVVRTQQDSQHGAVSVLCGQHDHNGEGDGSLCKGLTRRTKNRVYPVAPGGPTERILHGSVNSDKRQDLKYS